MMRIGYDEDDWTDCRNWLRLLSVVVLCDCGVLCAWRCAERSALCDAASLRSSAHQHIDWEEHCAPDVSYIIRRTSTTTTVSIYDSYCSSCVNQRSWRSLAHRTSSMQPVETDCHCVVAAVNAALFIVAANAFAHFTTRHTNVLSNASKQKQ